MGRPHRQRTARSGDRAARRGLINVRGIVASMIAFAIGGLLLEAVAGLWQKAIVAAALEASKNPKNRFDWKTVKPLEIHEFSGEQLHLRMNLGGDQYRMP